MLNDVYGKSFGDRVKLWTGDTEIEASALNQIRNLSALPILAGHIAIMPDVHMGKGATVGSVIPTKGAVIPSSVGSDIGCGMIAVQTNLNAVDLPESLADIRRQIERDVPVGFNCHQSGPKTGSHTSLGYRRIDLLNRFGRIRIMRKIKSFDEKRMENQIGTLGGGNHFIEICLDEANRVWIMLHSGSRNVGKTVGEVAMEEAKRYMKTMSVDLQDRDLAWLSEGTEEFDEYVEALKWAQEYAALNRDVMLELVMGAVQRAMPGKFLTTIQGVVNCHHNYLSREFFGGEYLWITRKGAVSARSGQLGIIPGSMGAKSFIVCGKGHEAAYCSCSHGAGRVMSRSEAKRRFTTEDVVQQTAGVECRKDDGIIDEIPSSYKDIDAVMAAQSDLVEIKHTLKQVLCVKG